MMKIGTGIGIPYLRGGTGYKMLLTSTGDGTGVSTISLTVSTDITLMVDNTARFYSDSAGTLDESTTWTVTTGATRTYYLKCPSGTANLTFSDRTKLTQWNAWTSSTNAASLGGDISKFVNVSRLAILGSNNISGDISGLTSLTFLQVYSSNTLSGDISGLTSLTYLRIYGSNNISGDISGLISLTFIGVSGYNTLSGDISGLTSLTYLDVSGYNTLLGDINPIVNGITFLKLTGHNHMDTYTSGATWTNATVTINPYTGYGYSSTEIDNMLIDMDNSVFNNVTITLQGSSAARTSASDTAVNDLVANGCTVITN